MSVIFFNVFKTSLNMMKDRGYEESLNILEELEKVPPGKDFAQMGDLFQNIGWNFKSFHSLEIKDAIGRFKHSYVLTNEKEKKKGFVIFGLSTKAFLVTVTSVILSYRLSPDFNRYKGEFVLILNKPFNSKFTARLDEISNYIDFRVHFDDSLQKRPFHALGPISYEKMEDDEVKLFLEESCLNTRQLKKISSNDPVIKYYGFPKKSLIRIKRTPLIRGSLLQSTLDYRLVV